MLKKIFKLLLHFDIKIGKRKLNAEGEYDPSSPTSETNDETPAKKVALTTDTEQTEEKEEAQPASPKKKTLPELDKYWKAVNEDPSDFTGWTYLLQYVDQEVKLKKTLINNKKKVKYEIRINNIYL